MFCANCGIKLDKGVSFCASCGTQVSDTSKKGVVGSGKDNAKRPSASKKEFHFGKTWVYSTVILSVVSTLLFGLLGAYEDGFIEPFIGIVLLSAVLGILVTFILKWRDGGVRFEGVSNSNEEEPSQYQGQKGLGGWLVLVAIGLLAAVAFSAYNVYTDITLFTDGSIEFLSNPSSEVYLPGYSGLMKFELIADLAFTLIALYLIYLFFTKSRKFPKYYIPFLVAVAVYVLIDYVLVASISVSGEVKQIINEMLSEQKREIARGFISALIWGTYMVKSKQVKATFVK